MISIKKISNKVSFLVISLIIVFVFSKSQITAQEKTLKGHEFTVLSLDIDKTGKYLVSGSYDTDVILWDHQDGELLKTFKGHTSGVWTVKISPDNRFVATGSWDNNRNASGSSVNCLNILDLKTLNVIKTLSIFPDSCIVLGLYPELDNISANGIYRIYFNPNGSKVAAITRRGDLFIWDIKNNFKRVVYVFSESKHRLRGLSPDWSHVVCSERKRSLIDSSFYLMRLGREDIVAKFNTPGRSVIGVHFSSNFKYIACISGDRIKRNEIDIWDIKSQKLLVTLKGHSSVVRSIAFSNDDKYLASAGEDNIVNLWNINTGKLIKSFSESNNKEITSVTFTPDQKYLISGSQESTIIYWDIEDWL